MEDLDSPWTQWLYWRDLDTDGAAELFCANGPWLGELGTSVQLVLQEGSATAEVRRQSSPDTAFHAFEFADVGQDGDSGVIVSDYADRARVTL